MVMRYAVTLLFMLSIVFLVILTTKTLHKESEPRCNLFFSNGTILYGVPLATTTSQHHKGLSGKDSVGSSMLFQFLKPGHLNFWMRNTYVPLSIGFLSADGVLTQIEDMKPNTDDYHISLEPALMALELRQGMFIGEGLKVGDRLVRKVCFILT